MDEKIRKQFEGLVGALSPENLSCDGELSRTAIMYRRRKLMKQWRELERKVGRSVSEEEIENGILFKLIKGTYSPFGKLA